MARSRPTLVTAALSVAAILGYVAYRSLQPERPSAPAGAATEAPAAEAAAPAMAATLPDFSLGNLAGEPQSIRSWPGKPLLINFWATWCGPCLNEIPMLKELQGGNPDLQVVGIAIDKRNAVVEFAQKMDFNYAILIGESDAWAAVAELGVNVYALPFTVFVAADGTLLGVHSGELHAEHLDRFKAVVDDLAAGRITVEAAKNRFSEPI